jgi:hypothetical protein
MCVRVCVLLMLQAFMSCGEKADKGEIEMAECLKEVRAGGHHLISWVEVLALIG